MGIVYIILTYETFPGVCWNHFNAHVIKVVKIYAELKNVLSETRTITTLYIYKTFPWENIYIPGVWDEFIEATRVLN